MVVNQTNPNDGVKNLCDRHWNILRPGILARTHCGLIVSKNLIEVAAADPRFVAIVNQVTPPHRSAGDVEMNYALRKTAPQCCFIGEANFVRVTRACMFANMPAKEAAHWRKTEDNIIALSKGAK